MGDILGYARVSTGDQDVAGQTMRLEKAGAIKVFTDVMSGKSMERPGLAELIAYARKGDTLAVVRLDRLGRSLAELLATVETLRGQGIALLSLEEKIDTSSAAGELIFHVFGAIAHFERRLISERTRDGIAAARAKGKQPGRQPLDMSKVDAAIKLVEARISPTEAARQLGNSALAGRPSIAKCAGWAWSDPLERHAIYCGTDNAVVPGSLEDGSVGRCPYPTSQRWLDWRRLRSQCSMGSSSRLCRFRSRQRYRRHLV